jgi:hypothetical protein
MQRAEATAAAEAAPHAQTRKVLQSYQPAPESGTLDTFVLLQMLQNAIGYGMDEHGNKTFGSGLEMYLIIGGEAAVLAHVDIKGPRGMSVDQFISLGARLIKTRIRTRLDADVSPAKARDARARTESVICRPP